MAHHLVKATIIPSIIKLISAKCNVSEFAALDIFYKSPTAKCLDNDETGLYGQSALYIFSLWLEDAER